MANKHGEFVWYELVTRDPDASKLFYDAVVGWTIEAQPAGEIDYRMIDTGHGLVGGVVRLTDAMVQGGARPGWLGYVGADDVDATAAAVTSSGGTVHLPPFDIPGIGRIAVVADPQGAVFDVMRGAAGGGTSNAFAPDVPGHVAWNELRTSDQDAGLAFYTGLFGWTIAGAMPMGAMGNYTFLTHGEMRLGAAMTSQPGGPPPAWLFYFQVADIEAAAAAVRAGGGSVEHGPTDVPGGNRVVIARDPQDTRFGLVGAA